LVLARIFLKTLAKENHELCNKTAQKTRTEKVLVHTLEKVTKLIISRAVQKKNSKVF